MNRHFPGPLPRRPAGTDAPQAAGTTPPAMTAALRCWSDTARQVRGTLNDLSPAVRGSCAERPDAAAIDRALDAAIVEITGGLTRFGDALTRLANEAHTPDAAAVGLRALLNDASATLPPQDLLQLMDRNGFIECSLQETLTQALGRLERLSQPVAPQRKASP